MKFVSICCDNCGAWFVRDYPYTKNFIMDNEKDECPSCCIIHGK